MASAESARAVAARAAAAKEVGAAAVDAEKAAVRARTAVEIWEPARTVAVSEAAGGGKSAASARGEVLRASGWGQRG